jgi:hypothetical protein
MDNDHSTLGLEFDEARKGRVSDLWLIFSIFIEKWLSGLTKIYIIEINKGSIIICN